jgi:hypothetical protein
MRLPLPKGLAIYVPIALARPDALEATAHKLGSSLAAIAAVMVEGLPFKGAHGPVTPRLDVDDFVHAEAYLRARGFRVVAVSFPAVDGDLDAARAHLAACCAATGAFGQLDAEPHAGKHWTPELLAPWLSADPDLIVTSTRAELPRLGRLDRELWLQLEQQTSTLTLDKALIVAERATPLERVVCVGGLFDDHDEPGTVARCYEE